MLLKTTLKVFQALLKLNHKRYSKLLKIFGNVTEINLQLLLKISDLQTLLKITQN